MINFVKTITMRTEIFFVRHLNSNLWRAFSILNKQKGAIQLDPTKIKWKKVLLKFFGNPCHECLICFLKYFLQQSCDYRSLLGLHQNLTLESFNFILDPKASFRYIFKIALGTRLLYCRSLNNYEFILILQFFKCSKTKPLQVWSLANRKTTLLSKNFAWPF